jgi:mannose PTS system EIIAB component
MKADRWHGAALSELVSFLLVRVDDRLLHGQFVLNWARLFHPRCIAVVVDDVIAQNAMVRSVLFAVAPRDVALWVGTVAEALEHWANGINSPETTIFLLPSPIVARHLFDAGLSFCALSIGCLGMQAGRMRVLSQISLSGEELGALRYLATRGVRVTAQILPTDHVTELGELMCRVPSL